jgi:hypothetical protein
VCEIDRNMCVVCVCVRYNKKTEDNRRQHREREREVYFLTSVALNVGSALSQDGSVVGIELDCFLYLHGPQFTGQCMRSKSI